MEVETDADSNDITECLRDDKQVIGMFGLSVILYLVCHFFGFYCLFVEFQCKKHVVFAFSILKDFPQQRSQTNKACLFLFVTSYIHPFVHKKSFQ